MHAHICVHAHTPVCVLKYMHKHIHACLQAHNKHTYTHRQIQTHTPNKQLENGDFTINAEVEEIL